MGQGDGPGEAHLVQPVRGLEEEAEALPADGNETVEEAETVVEVDGALLPHGPYFILRVLPEGVEEGYGHHHVAQPVRQIYYRLSSHFARP